MTRMHSLLAEAKGAGLIEVDDNEVRFSKMQIGEMIYNELPDSRKLELHYKIADLFYSGGVDSLSTTEIVLMTTSFNHSLDRVRANEKQQLSAELNYRAGKISQKEEILFSYGKEYRNVIKYQKRLNRETFLKIIVLIKIQHHSFTSRKMFD